MNTRSMGKMSRGRALKLFSLYLVIAPAALIGIAIASYGVNWLFLR